MFGLGCFMLFSCLRQDGLIWLYAEVLCETISRVSDQNGVSPIYIMLEIHRSGWEPSICTRWGCELCNVR